MSYAQFYISENIISHAGMLGITKLSPPRLFIQFEYEATFYTSFEDFVASITVTEWLDGTKPSHQDQQMVLMECWEFLSLTEEEEDRLAELRGDLD